MEMANGVEPGSLTSTNIEPSTNGDVKPTTDAKRKVFLTDFKNPKEDGLFLYVSIARSFKCFALRLSINIPLLFQRTFDGSR